VDQLDIAIPLVPLDKLRETACLQYNAMWKRRGKYRRRATLYLEGNFIDRITVNLLKHNFCNYDAEINHLVSRGGTEQEILRLKFRVLERIAQVYPELRSECERQVAVAKRGIGRA
jgi:hypothetical protein